MPREAQGRQVGFTKWIKSFLLDDSRDSYSAELCCGVVCSAVSN